jgi:hypothetical protein
VVIVTTQIQKRELCVNSYYYVSPLEQSHYRAKLIKFTWMATLLWNNKRVWLEKKNNFYQLSVQMWVIYLRNPLNIHKGILTDGNILKKTITMIKACLSESTIEISSLCPRESQQHSNRTTYIVQNKVWQSCIGVI